MEVVLDTKKIIVLAVVFILLLSGMIYFAIAPSLAKSPAKTVEKTVENDMDTMTWEQILEESRGQTVKVAALNDVGINAMLDNLVKIAKDSYDITVVPTHVAGYAAANENYNGGNILETATADIYWMSCAAYGYQNYAGLWWDVDWQTKIPNAVYLKDDSNDLVATYIGNTTGYVGNQVAYSGAQMMLAYNTECQDPLLSWNVVKVIDGSTTKYISINDNGTATTGEAATFTSEAAAADNVDLSKALNATNLKSYLTGLEDAGKSFFYGLPNTYLEFLSFAEFYEGQVTYPYIGGGQYYIGYLFLSGAAYELKDDGAGGYVACATQVERDANVEYVNDIFKNTPDAIKLDDGGNLVVDSRLAYLRAYVDDLDAVKSTTVDHTEASNGYYVGANGVTQLNQMIIGKTGGTNVWSNESVMLGMTTLQSITMRQQGVYVDTGIYCLSTAPTETYCWTIGSNSANKAACLVLMNWFEGPEGQAQLLEITGNPMNMDVAKYLNYNGAKEGVDYSINEAGLVTVLKTDKRIMKEYNNYFGFIKTWADDPAMAKEFATPGKLAETGVVCTIAKYSSQLVLLQTKAGTA